MASYTTSEIVEWLRCVIDVEQRVFVWSEAMNNANARIQKVYDAKNMALDNFEKSQNSIQTIDTRYDNYLEQSKAAGKSYAKKFRKYAIKKVVSTIFFVVGLLIWLALICGLVSGNIISGFDISSFIIREGIGMLVVIAIICAFICAPLWVPSMIFMIISSVKCKNYKKSVNQEKSRDLRSEKETERDNLMVEYEASKQLCVDLEEEERVITERQKWIYQNYMRCQEYLQKLYGMNILAQKYRRFEVVCVIYDYFQTGQCVSLYGHGGAIDTYEKERMNREQLGELRSIREIAMDVRENQEYLIQEARRANDTLARIEQGNERMREYQLETNESLRRANESLYRIEMNYR